MSFCVSAALAAKQMHLKNFNYQVLYKLDKMNFDSWSGVRVCFCWHNSSFIVTGHSRGTITQRCACENAEINASIQ
jgi:hypothetical protein